MLGALGQGLCLPALPAHGAWLAMQCQAPAQIPQIRPCILVGFQGQETSHHAPPTPRQSRRVPRRQLPCHCCSVSLQSLGLLGSLRVPSLLFPGPAWGCGRERGIPRPPSQRLFLPGPGQWEALGRGCRASQRAGKLGSLLCSAVWTVSAGDRPLGPWTLLGGPPGLLPLVLQSQVQDAGPGRGSRAGVPVVRWEEGTVRWGLRQGTGLCP